MWAHGLSMVLGVWLMAAPELLGHRDPARTNDHIIGPLVFTVACMALFEATRNVRRANTFLGAWLLLAPLVLGYPTAPFLNSLATGSGVLLLSLVRGRVKGQYGGGWAVLWGRAPEIR
jgi:hypothetical protein